MASGAMSNKIKSSLLKAPSSGVIRYKFNSSLLTAHLTKESLPPTIAKTQLPAHNLYQLLSILPNDGVGAMVRQARWARKGLDTPSRVELGNNEVQEVPSHRCYWEVTRVVFKRGGNNGKAWGRLFWRGKQVTPLDSEERIRGALKYKWKRAFGEGDINDLNDV